MKAESYKPRTHQVRKDRLRALMMKSFDRYRRRLRKQYEGSQSVGRYSFSVRPWLHEYCFWGFMARSERIDTLSSP